MAIRFVVHLVQLAAVHLIMSSKSVKYVKNMTFICTLTALMLVILKQSDSHLIYFNFINWYLNNQGNALICEEFRYLMRGIEVSVVKLNV